MPKHKVMITDYKFDSIRQEEDILNKHNIEVLSAQCKTEEDILKIVPRDVNGLIVQYAKIGKKVFDYLPELKVVGCYGIGVDSVDIESATEHEVTVVNVPDYCIDEVANHTIALLFDSIRKVSLYNKDIKNKKVWDFNVHRPIYSMKNKKLGFIGFGKIAQNMVKKLTKFGLQIIVYDPYLTEEKSKKYNITKIDFQKLLKEADYISINAPLNDSTRHILSYNEFKVMKNSSYIINTARGSIIDENALAEAIKNNEIAGAALDVIEKEPIDKSNKLLDFDNVILTPHVAFYSEDSLKKLQKNTAQNVADVLIGRKSKSVVNKLFDKLSN